MTIDVAGSSYAGGSVPAYHEVLLADLTLFVIFQDLRLNIFNQKSVVWLSVKFCLKSCYDL